MRLRAPTEQEVAMSQCHDSYPDTEGMAAAPGAVARLRIPHPASGGNRRGGVPVHDCELLSEEHAGVYVVRVVGPLDWATAPGFRSLVCEHCRDAPVVVLNLRATWLDAAGTGSLLVSIQEVLDRGHHVAIVATDPRQLSVLVSSGVNDHVPIVASEQAALAWCRRGGLVSGGEADAAAEWDGAGR
jgi:anti-anti-sigma factor